MGKFDNANNKVFKDIAKSSSEIANVLQIKNVHTDYLHDFKDNNEDVDKTDDLELSIEQNGFTDPLEITDFGNEDGHYTICSGHRRRRAGLKKGMEYFPSIVKKFNTELELRNYVLFGNSQRNTEQDPLLYCTRYKMHEQYLKDSNFKGSFREEIAKRLGISVQQADRYKDFNKVILPVWEMVREKTVGMSSVMPLASHSIEEQAEIVTIMDECLANDEKLTRETCDKIIKAYRNGKRSYLEIAQLSLEIITADIGIDSDDVTPNTSNVRALTPVTPFINTEPSETRDTIKNRNSEVRREHDDYTSDDKNYDDEKPDYDEINKLNEINDRLKNDSSESKSKTEKETSLAHGEAIIKISNKLESALSENYSFESEEQARTTLKTLGTLVNIMIEEMRDISKDYNQDNTFKASVKSIYDSVEKIMKL